MMEFTATRKVILAEVIGDLVSDKAHDALGKLFVNVPFSVTYNAHDDWEARPEHCGPHIVNQLRVSVYLTQDERVACARALDKHLHSYDFSADIAEHEAAMWEQRGCDRMHELKEGAP